MTLEEVKKEVEKAEKEILTICKRIEALGVHLDDIRLDYLLNYRGDKYSYSVKIKAQI